MKKYWQLFLPCLLIVLVGCYAARVETGLQPSNQTIKQGFAACWLWGLVPPKTVDAAMQCPNGVAVVETQLSFVNQLVQFLTLGIYSPMQIVVTCAEGSTGLLENSPSFSVDCDATLEEVQEIYSKAADEAVRTGLPVYVYTIN
jgi:hypothetical protein